MRGWFCARAAAAADDHGVCVAWYAAAGDALAPRVVATAGAGARRPDALNALRAAVRAAHDAAKHDNDRVYYATVPSESALKPPPAMKTMGPEAPSPAYLDVVPLRGPVLSDEELARKLDAELNA